LRLRRATFGGKILGTFLSDFELRGSLPLGDEYLFL
jgi:hypothetical protein